MADLREIYPMSRLEQMVEKHVAEAEIVPVRCTEVLSAHDPLGDSCVQGTACGQEIPCKIVGCPYSTCKDCRRGNGIQDRCEKGSCGHVKEDASEIRRTEGIYSSKNTCTDTARAKWKSIPYQVAAALSISNAESIETNAAKILHGEAFGEAGVLAKDDHPTTQHGLYQYALGSRTH